MHGVDRNIGLILRALEDSNLLQNTLIAFSSDNGGSPWSGGFNYPFRGGKATPLEGGTRVPAFIYGPKFLKKKSGSVHKGLFHIADWYPTFISFAQQTSEPGTKWVYSLPKNISLVLINDTVLYFRYAS